MHIDIRFYKSDDPERDRRKLQRIHRAFIAHPGKNTFSLHIDNGSRITIVDFPNHTTGYSDDLMHELVDIVGEDNIHVEDSDNPPES